MRRSLNPFCWMNLFCAFLTFTYIFSCVHLTTCMYTIPNLFMELWKLYRETLQSSATIPSLSVVHVYSMFPYLIDNLVVSKHVIYLSFSFSIAKAIRHCGVETKAVSGEL